MEKKFPYDLLENPETLAGFQGWSKEVYQDLLAVQQNVLTEQAFHDKYIETRAIFILDMTSFTESAIRYGALAAFLRILDVQKVCAPVLQRHGALGIRTFADDITATFMDPTSALNAALEIHERVQHFNQSPLASPYPAYACIGLGYGEVFHIGMDRAMGDQMNQASKLGEDTAEAGETLLTESFYHAVAGRTDCHFEPRQHPGIPFLYYAASSKTVQTQKIQPF